MATLNTKAWWSVAILAVAMGVLLFVPAGTIRYWPGWAYLSVFVGATILTTRYLMIHDPALLERRMRAGPTAERRPAQRIIMLFTSVGFIALLVVPALDFRFGWSHVPTVLVAAGNVLVGAGFLLIVRVYRENTFTSATIEVSADQRVIATGPYAIVRHPMYASGLLYLLATPIALGSYWGLVVFAGLVPFLLWRILDEEQFLAQTLPGYTQYQHRVRYRLLPPVW